MSNKRIAISLILLAAAAIVVTMVISQPFKVATANVNPELPGSSLPFPVNANSAVPNSIVVSDPNIGENTEFSEPIVKESKEPTDLIEVRDSLRKKINITLLKPGWVNIHKQFASFTEAEDEVVPETGQVIPKNSVFEQWILVDEDLSFSVNYSQSKSLAGEEYFATLFSNGKHWPPSQPELLEKVDFPFLMELQFLDDLIAEGNTANAKIEYKTEENQRFVTITSAIQFPSPIGINGWDEANAILYAAASTYNWETGLFTSAEGWITREDGSVMKISSREMSVSQSAEVSQQVIEKINNLGE